MLKKTTKVRMVIPTFNRSEKLLLLFSKIGKAFDNPDFEVVVVDDRSSDSHKLKLSQLSMDFPSVEFIFLERNHGGGYARNVGCFHGESKPDWVWFLDDDDIVSLKTIENLLFRLPEINSNDLLFLSARYHKRPSVNELTPAGGGVFELFSKKGHQVNTSCALFRYSLLEKLSGWDSQLVAGQDTDIFLRAAEKSDATVMDDLFVDVYDHDGERITKNPRKQLKGKVQFLRKHYRRLHPIRSAKYFLTIITLYPYLRSIFGK